MIKISIIVPVFNTAEYLPKCLDSLMNQKLQNIEVIIVNDGATDNSQDIINSYIDKYSLKIRAFYKTNGGLSSARNFGLEHVQGEYIGFVDSDDWIEPKMYEEMLKVAKTNDSDIVCCGYKEVYQEKISHKLATLNKDKKFYADVIACNKIYKTAFWKKYNFSYFLNIYHEDAELFPLIFSKTDKIDYIDIFYYCYNKANLSSITVNYKMHLESWKQIIINYIGYIKEGKIHPDFHIIIYGIIIRLMLQHQTKDVIATFGKVYPILQNSETLPFSRKIILFLLYKSPDLTKKLLAFKVLIYSKLKFNE